MDIIVIKTQAEMDNQPKKFKNFTILEIRSKLTNSSVLLQLCFSL